MRWLVLQLVISIGQIFAQFGAPFVHKYLNACISGSPHAGCYTVTVAVTGHGQAIKQSATTQPQSNATSHVKLNVSAGGRRISAGAGLPRSSRVGEAGRGVVNVNAAAVNNCNYDITTTTRTTGQQDNSNPLNR